MFARLLSLLAITASVVVAGGANSLKDCSAGTSKFKFTSASLTPDPVVPGQDASLTINMDIPADTIISDGSVKYSTVLNYIPVYSETDTLCSQVTCPLVSGPYTNTTVSTFPDVSGKLVSKIEWYDTSNTLLYCLEMTTKS